VSRSSAYTLLALAYVAAGVAAVATGALLSGSEPLRVAFAADVVATVVVFGFSMSFDNSSFYDPYWSVAPLALGLYWLASAGPSSGALVRDVVVLVLVGAWGVRLTYNFLRGWQGLGHEDFRYVDLRAKSGRAYWLVSFFGIHLFPTLMVFAGCLPIYAVLHGGVAPLGPLDAVAVLVTASAIAVETRADAELRRFRQRVDRRPEDVLETGLWAYSRHPNYFGEILFWWGLYLFALSASPARRWTGVGALAITLMFRFVSLRLIEDRMLARRPGFANRMRTTSAIVPWFRRAP
jgi:steroid 5-alpha reductase family enzyme